MHVRTPRKKCARRSGHVREHLMAKGIANGYFAPTMYKGSDGHVYLRFFVQSIYYLSYRVDSMFVGNGRIVEAGEVTQTITDATPDNEEL